MIASFISDLRTARSPEGRAAGWGRLESHLMIDGPVRTFGPPLVAFDHTSVKGFGRAMPVACPELELASVGTASMRIWRGSYQLSPSTSVPFSWIVCDVETRPGDIGDQIQARVRSGITLWLEFDLRFDLEAARVATGAEFNGRTCCLECRIVTGLEVIGVRLLIPSQRHRTSFWTCFRKSEHSRPTAEFDQS